MNFRSIPPVSHNAVRPIRHRRKRAGESNGFSLVEMLIVIAVVGIISAIAIPAFTRVHDHSEEKAARNNAQRLADVATTANAAGLNFNTDGTTATAVAAIVQGQTLGGDVMGNTFFGLPGLSDEDQEAALQYLRINDEGVLAFSGGPSLASNPPGVVDSDTSTGDSSSTPLTGYSSGSDGTGDTDGDSGTGASSSSDASSDGTDSEMMDAPVVSDPVNSGTIGLAETPGETITDPNAGSSGSGSGSGSTDDGTDADLIDGAPDDTTPEGQIQTIATSLKAISERADILASDPDLEQIALAQLSVIQLREDILAVGTDEGFDDEIVELLTVSGELQTQLDKLAVANGGQTTDELIAAGEGSGDDDVVVVTDLDPPADGGSGGDGSSSGDGGSDTGDDDGSTFFGVEIR